VVRGGRAAATPAEEVLCTLFAEVLGLEHIGAEDSFFELGGDSILSMMLVSGARKAGLVITARQVFEQPTPAGLAAVAGAVGDGALPGGGDPGVGEVPLTPVMHELLDRASPDRAGEVTQSRLVFTPAGLDFEALTGAVQALADHHDALRARLEGGADGETWRLVVPEAVEAGQWLHRVDATGLEGYDLRRLVEEQTRAAVGRLDPQAGVMVQLVWFDTGPDRSGRLLITIGHLVVDGVSWRVLLPDLAEAYTSLAAGRETALQPVQTSFRHFARALSAQARSKERLAELPQWSRLLQGPDPLFGSRTVDPGRDVEATMSQLSVKVPAGITSALLTCVPAAFNAGIEDVLLTGLTAAIAEWRRRQGQTAAGILVDLEGHGRISASESVDLSRTVGWFTNTYPVRLDVGAVDFNDLRAGGPAAGRAVKRVKEQLRAIPGDGLGYGMLRYLNPGTAPVLAALPSAQIGFNYLGRIGAAKPADQAGSQPDRKKDWQPATEGGGPAGTQVPVMHGLEVMPVVHDLPDGPELSLVMMWPRELLEEPTVQALLDSWAAMLSGLAGHTPDSGSGGHTPSDFPLVEISQDELDEFEASAKQIEEGA
jgi:non-ribosomal peptide synthase protein (TIGR01720 family)